MDPQDQTMCRDTFVSEEVDCSSSSSRTVAEEVCVAEDEGGSSSWPVAEGCPNISALNLHEYTIHKNS